MERKGKIIALFIANALFVLATIGLIILASTNWGRGKKKDYDMSGVVFDDLTVEYDGQPHSILATNLPEGVSVSYDNNDQTEIGTYTVTAHFYGDEERYNPIPDKTATLTVSKPAKSRILSATGFEIDETSEPPRIYCDVSNTTEQIDLSDKITVMPNRTWKLFEDADGDNELITKSMSLETGHNTAYIIIYDLLNNTSIYEVDVYRLDMKSYTFKNEGQIHASGEIEEKSQLESPAIPEKTYYTFTGWAIEGSTDIVQFPYTVTEDITFVAQYTPTNYAITYYLDGGINNEGNPQYYTIESSDIELYPATRDGYVFDGWYSDGEFGTQVTVIQSGTFGAKSLYAKWTPIKYKINYYLNGGTNDDKNPEYYDIETPNITLLPAFREHYDFAGWFADEGFGTRVTVIERGSFGEKNLYAKWTPKEYEITYYLYGGENDNRNPASYNIETPDIKFYPATRDGYVFDGWYSDGEFGTQVTVIQSGTFGAKSLYAKWEYGSGGLIYEQIGNEYKVVGYNGNEREIIVPDKWQGLPVTAIDKGVFENCTNLEKLTIPFVGATKDGDTNTHFGYIFGAPSYSDNAKYVPSSLKTVIITGGTAIYDYAFYNCANIQSITIPDSVDRIQDNAFEYCESLESVTFGEESDLYHIGCLAFSNCTNLKSIEIPYFVFYIGEYAFMSCTSLESVTFEDNGRLYYIDGMAFYNCSKLKSIKIPDNVKYFGRYAFGACTSLEEITLPFVGGAKNWNTDTNFGFIFGASSYSDNAKYVPSSLKTVIITGGTAIYDYAFYDCAYIQSITIPDSVTEIGFGAFEGCTGLEKITLPFVGVTKDGTTNTHFGYIFGADTYEENSTAVPSSLKTVIITGGTSIDKYAFWYCVNLTSITLPDSIKRIGTYAFNHCENLDSITIPDKVTSISYCAFQSCKGLKSVTFSEQSKLTTIDSHAFWFCTNLTSITIPDNVTSIYGFAFGHCESLTNITIPDGVTTIGFGAFYNCINLEKLTIPFVGATKGGDTNTHFGYLFCADSYNENSTYVPTSLKTVKITGGTTIGEEAFYQCTSLESIEIPASVNKIGTIAFRDCTALTAVYVTDIASWCNIHFVSNSANPLFYAHNLYLNNELVTTLKIPASVTKISSFAFWGCTSITSVVFGEDSKLNTIGTDAFSGCTNLKSITIPAAVTSIRYEAFRGCASLESVIFKNTSGWTADGINISSEDLEDPATAAKYLKDTYCLMYWKRS